MNGAATVGTVIIGSVSVIVASLVITGTIQHARRTGHWVAYAIAAGAAVFLVGVVFQTASGAAPDNTAFATSINLRIVSVSPVEVVGIALTIIAFLLYMNFEPVPPADSLPSQEPGGEEPSSGA